MMIPIKLEKRTEGEQKAYAEGYAAGKRDAVRHGRWIDIPFTARWICSNCDYISEFASFKYCPDCGAIMDLEDEE